MKKIAISIIAGLLLFANILFAQHYKKDGTPDKRYKENKTTTYTPHKTTTTSAPKNKEHKSSYAANVPRDSHGKIKRSSKATYEFKKQTGYPKGRKGYVIDHIVPLKKGGCDCPANMQWQTKEDAKKKDKVE